MDNSKITYILRDKLGAPLNTWTRLPQVSIIFLNQDSSIHVDPVAQLFFIDIKNGLLKISSNKETVNLEEYDDLTDEDSFVVDKFVDFDLIAGIITTSVPGSQGTYYTRGF